LELQNKYNIDSNRIYGTGQSMGANILLYLLAHNQNLFTSSLIIDGHWVKDDLLGLINSSFTYLVTGGDDNSFKYQKEVKNYFNLFNITYGVITNLNAQEKVVILNKKLNKIYLSNYKYNFISYDNLK
jgi:predicted peptidase